MIQWLSIVGLGENGVEGLSLQAQAHISAASLVVGGKRHLELAGGLITGDRFEWPSPLEQVIPQLLAKRPQPVCVLASGDPFTYGIGSTLVRHIPFDEMHVFPAPSIFTLVAAKLGWALQDTITIGLNGRPLERIIPHLQPSARIIALSTDDTTPALLAALLTERGLGAAMLTCLEHVGGPQERIRRSAAESFAFTDIAKLNCMAIEMPAHAAAIPLASGLDDSYFNHDGQLTKREIRAVTLSALAPKRGELLWDIGLGAGSIAIEWLLRDPSMRAIGIEKHPERAERARANAKTLGVPHLNIVEGDAPAVLSGLEAPDAIFIGGGATAPAMLETAWAALKPDGRMVINSVSLGTEALLLASYKLFGGTLTRIGVERAGPVGAITGWRPAMHVTQWSVTK